MAWGKEALRGKCTSKESKLLNWGEAEAMHPLLENSFLPPGSQWFGGVPL